MNIVTLSLILIGIVLILIGYLEMLNNKKSVTKKIEYRFVPRNVYDNISANDIDDQFNFMFDMNDTRNNTNLV